MPYLIDGHNIIARMPDISLLDPHDEAKLVQRLRGFCARSGKAMTVIFDNGLPGGESRMSSRLVKVIFASGRRMTADEMIVRRIRKERDPNKWIIVTSDREVRAVAEAYRMKTIPAHEFIQMLRSPKKAAMERGENPHLTLSKAEVDEWMRIFGVEDDD